MDQDDDDDDREYDLANNFTARNTDYDDNEIDSDLEEKLYSAVFHSNYISCDSEEPAEQNNFNSISDVVNSWKNINDKQSKGGDFLIEKNKGESCSRYSPVSPVSSVSSVSPEKIVGPEIHGEVSNEILDSKYHAVRDRRKDVLDRGGNLLDKSIQVIGELICSDNTGPNCVLPDREARVDVFRDKETASQSDGLQIYTMKKQKNSPKSSAKSKDHLQRKSYWANDAENNVDVPAETDSRNNSTVSPSACESLSEIRARGELEKNELSEETMEERRISFASFKPSGFIENAAADESSDIKPEEDSSTNCKVNVGEKSSKEAEVKPEETKAANKPEEEEEKEKEEEEVATEKSAPMKDFRASISCSDSSSSDSNSRNSSSSSFEETTQRGKEVRDKILTEKRQRDEIITLDDSEGSIYEVPVPPKPRPPTINLDDSESSESSDSDVETEILTPKELVESYRRAVSESGSRGSQAGVLGENSTPQSNRVQERRASSSLSDSDDSMTESEEENWGIIAGSKIIADKPDADHHRELTAPDIADQTTTDAEQGDSRGPINESGNKSGDFVSEERENQAEIHQSRSFSEISNESGGESSSANFQALEKRPVEPQEILTENNEKEKDSGREEALIINVEIARDCSIEEIGGDETPRRISESRKRPMTGDSGKKSKPQNSPKKARSSDDSGNNAAGSSSSKSTRDKENAERQRNCAADYFFTPMNNEMEDFYNKSWGGENFDIDEIKRQMPRDQRHWAVLSEDLLSYQQRRSRYWSETKCRNCRHTGHHMAECPEQRKVPSCHMCGAPGHREPRCPHKMCLGCGKKQKTYMQVCNGCRRAWCNGCQSYGHIEDNCPDLWRRYHVTTSHNDVNTHMSVENVMKPQHLLSCCNCAKRGHDSTTCDNYRWSRHFPTPSYVTNYTTGPEYPENQIRDDFDSPSETRERIGSEKRVAEDDTAHRSSSSSEGRKRRSGTDPGRDEVLQTVNKDVDKSKGGDKAREKERSSQEKTQRSRELIPANPRAKEGGEILLTLKSPLLDAEFTQASNFGKSIFPLFVNQYEELTNSDMSRDFLLNLTSQFPISIEIKRSANGELAMTIASTKDLHQPIQLTIMDWLKYPVDERSRFVNLNLPTKKEDLMKLLESKLEELKTDLGDPFGLNETIKALKKELKSLQNHSIAGKKSSTSSQRARVVEKLAQSQCRLNMIFFGQVKLKRSGKSCKFLEGALRDMKKIGSESYISASMYLLILHHYNIIFSPYTPDHLNNLLDLYWQRYSTPNSRKSRIKNWNKAHSNLTKAVKNGNKPRPAEGPCKILMENLVNDRSGAGNGVENQFLLPGASFAGPNVNPKSKLPPPRFPMIYDLDRLESNYYNSQYDFGDNSRQKSREAQKNLQQDDYIALDNRSMKNNHYNVEKDLQNAGADMRRKLRSHYPGKSPSKIRSAEGIDNGLQNYQGENNQSNFSPLPGRNKWQENFSRHNLSSQEDMFFSDTRAESSQNYSQHSTALEKFSRNPIDGNREGRHDGIDGPSTSGINNQARIYHDDMTNSALPPGPSKNKKKRKKPNKDTTALTKVQKRKARKAISKYIGCGVPYIEGAARDLERRLIGKDLTLRQIIRFQSLAKRKLLKSVLGT